MTGLYDRSIDALPPVGATRLDAGMREPATGIAARAEAVLGDRDALLALGPRGLPASAGGGHSGGEAEHEHSREAAGDRRFRRHGAGEYQIGIIGTSFGIVIPNFFAAYAVQRGVGISMTRPQ